MYIRILTACWYWHFDAFLCRSTAVIVVVRATLWIYLRETDPNTPDISPVAKGLLRWEDTPFGAHHHLLASQITGLSDGAEHRGAELQQSRIAVPVSGTPPRRRFHERIDQLHDGNPLRALRSAGRDRGGAEEEAVRQTAGARGATAAAAPRHVSPSPSPGSAEKTQFL